MNRPGRLALVALALIMLSAATAGCQVLAPKPSATLPPTPTVALPPADETAFAFLQAWERSDYAAMYSLLSVASRQKYAEGEFTTTYQEVVKEAGILSVAPEIRAAFQPGAHAEVSFDASFETALMGTFATQNKMGLTYTGDRWGVDWSLALILPQLSDDAFVQLRTWTPSRGNIYDRNGLGLAVQGERVEVGVIPGKIQDEAAVLTLLNAILGQPTQDIQERYAAAPTDWYVPLGEISAEAAQINSDLLSATPGIEMRRSWTRSYDPEIIAPHVVGVVGPILEAELQQWQAKGYTGDEVVGRMGLERWGEAYLGGQRGGRLEIVTNKGETAAVLAEQATRENNSLYTTFDREFQKKVQDILGQRQGAIVVLEAQTGRVLALATYPNFDPNLFPTGISAQAWQQLQADPKRPLVNRATQGAYPPGSMFKSVTMTAGLEAGGLTGDSAFTCNGIWTGLGPQWPKTCWARGGHGRISLAKALTVSCDITFYQVGLLLNGLGPNLLPDYARKFGLGAKTGLEVEEEAGLVPDPAWKMETKGEGWAPGDSVNMAIGQSELQVTPLQAAVLYAALGNGGTLYRPQMVEMIAVDPNHPDWAFQPAVAGKLPISAAHLAVIQDSLYKVTSSQVGTAYRPFQGLSVPVAGKTGTAESGQALPHAWFAGFAPAQNPEITIAVIVEHSGEGSVFAAPLFRKVVEAYFHIEPTPTPGPTPTATPKP